ncbi:hypothetical protein ICV32_01570 [Polynucleobacter sp. MWH-UH24A]|uniref:hypothetical protein n=1 Tax=Polynucleobacter sp. MWH-UH24A TaxID=2689110 RepID=UPI001BFD58AE|nr:hypothetical protein [Polynucleobacter sp. MWH-UH24A]QWD76389.1 hypothetical protein ICV32_01570 [Polynucleobacter sp. MWH-UH24A]
MTSHRELNPHRPISESSVLLAGPVRNVAGVIEREVQTLMASLIHFKSIDCLVVESDSNDDTVKKLAELTKTIPQFSYVSMGQLSQHYPRRTDRIALCRNVIIDAVAQNPAYAHIDYIAMADMDGMNSLITPEKITQCWKVSEPWDVITANQLGPYYDTWALKHPDWNPTDCWQQRTALENIIGYEAAENLAITAKQVALDPSAGLIEVDSAFGGFAIYRREAFLAGRYVGSVSEGRLDEICEHISYHAELRQKGYRIYINCALINCEHQVVSKRAEMILKWIQALGLLVFGKKRLNKYLDLIKAR